MPHRTFTLTACAIFALLSGCSTYVDNYNYRPRPAIAEVPPAPGKHAPPVTGLASVIGVRNEDRKDGLPPCVEIRLRIENNGTDDLTFDPQTMELLDGLLLKFPQPIARPPQVVTLRQNEVAVFSAFFPFPPGHSYHNTDLDSLQLRWLTRVEGHNEGLGVNFHRVASVYYSSNPSPVFFGFGFGASHRFR